MADRVRAGAVTLGEMPTRVLLILSAAVAMAILSAAVVWFVVVLN